MTVHRLGVSQGGQAVRGEANRATGRLLATVAVMGFLLGANTTHHLGDKVVISIVIPTVGVV